MIIPQIVQSGLSLSRPMFNTRVSLVRTSWGAGGSTAVEHTPRKVGRRRSNSNAYAAVNSTLPLPPLLSLRPHPTPLPAIWKQFTFQPMLPPSNRPNHPPSSHPPFLPHPPPHQASPTHHRPHPLAPGLSALHTSHPTPPPPSLPPALPHAPQPATARQRRHSHSGAVTRSQGEGVDAAGAAAAAAVATAAWGGVLLG